MAAWDKGSRASVAKVTVKVSDIRALIIRTGLWGPLYCNYNKDTPEIVGNY